jgi:hypothetical protein
MPSNNFVSIVVAVLCLKRLHGTLPREEKQSKAEQAATLWFS